jgi:hypothetical protein
MIERPRCNERSKPKEEIAADQAAGNILLVLLITAIFAAALLFVAHLDIRSS